MGRFVRIFILRVCLHGEAIQFHFQILVMTVKELQKKSIQGVHGTWKQFLSNIDKSASIPGPQDPARRPVAVLEQFIESLNSEESKKVRWCDQNLALFLFNWFFHCENKFFAVCEKIKKLAGREKGRLRPLQFSRLCFLQASCERNLLSL